MYFEFTLGELKDVKDDLKKIERNLEYSRDKTQDAIDSMTEYGSNYGITTTEVLEEKHDSLVNALEMVETFSSRIDEIIEAIEYTETVENEDVTFIYDSEVLDNWIDNIKDILDTSNSTYSSIFNLDDAYTSWEKEMTNELDNPDAGLNDIVEEAKQQDDEQVFRHNRSIMQGLELKLKEVISGDFADQTDNIDSIREKLEGLTTIDELSDIRDIVLDSVKGGKAPDASKLDNVMDSKVMLYSIAKNYLISNISFTQTLKKVLFAITLIIPFAI